jgi:hypothetical protein
VHAVFAKGITTTNRQNLAFKETHFFGSPKLTSWSLFMAECYLQHDNDSAMWTQVEQALNANTTPIKRNEDYGKMSITLETPIEPDNLGLSTQKRVEYARQEDWETYRRIIMKLYFEDDKCLPEVIELMKGSYNFVAT